MKRRTFLTSSSAAMAATAVAAGTAVAGPPEVAPNPQGAQSRVRIALNTSTIRGQQLTLPEQVRVAAEAGYDAIEPWIRDLRQYVDQGGSLTDLRKQIEDAGLTVESSIGFARWIVDDPQVRAAGLNEAVSDMELIARIGGKRLAAPPIGSHRPEDQSPPLSVIAQRYHDLLLRGENTGVVPQLELWGFSPTLSRLGEVAYVVAEAGHPDACYLLDFYHIFKGGSDFAGLGALEARQMHVFHINDYPALPPRESIADKDRVYPGDGICPLTQIIQQLVANGFEGYFSLELFNPTYWQQDALAVAKTGLAKIREVLPAE